MMTNFQLSITLVCHDLRCGGTERVICKLANYYSLLGHKVEILFLGPIEIFYGYNLDDSVKLTSLSSLARDSLFAKILNPILLIIQLRKQFINNAGNTFISFLTVPTLFSLFGALFIKVNLVGCERTNPYLLEAFPWYWRILRNIFYFRLTNLVVQTSEIAGFFKRIIKPSKIIIIPNSIDKTFSNQNKNYSKIKEGPLELLFIGRFEYEKGVDVLMKAMLIIKKELKSLPFRLTMLADGSLRSDLKKTIVSENLFDCIYLHPPSNNVEVFLERSSIVILPSRYEGMSNVLLEAMGTGNCVITTRDGSSGVINNGLNGILINELTALNLIEQIKILNNDREKIISIGKEAKRTSECFYEQNVLKLWEEIL